MEKYFDILGNELYKYIVDGTNAWFITETSYPVYPVAGVEFNNDYLHQSFCKDVINEYSTKCVLDKGSSITYPLH